MDQTKTLCVSQDKGSYSQGHEVTYEVTVSNLLTLKSWPIEKIYTTECQHYPTAWDLKVEFLEVREDATASLFVSLKRSDSESIDLEAILCIQICSGRDVLIFPKQTFEKKEMWPGDELQETVEMSAFPLRRDEIHRRLVVDISIMVCFCHDGTNSSASMSIADADEDADSDSD